MSSTNIRIGVSTMIYVRILSLMKFAIMSANDEEYNSKSFPGEFCAVYLQK